MRDHLLGGLSLSLNVHMYANKCTEQAVNEGNNRLLGLDFDLACFPSFHPRLASFTPGLDRVLLAMQRKFLHSKRRGHVDDAYAPLIPVLVHLMLHFIDEWEVFALLSHLVVRTAWLDHSKAQAAASHCTLLQLLHSHAVSPSVWNRN